jgi:hypothetical protein
MSRSLELLALRGRLPGAIDAAGDRDCLSLPFAPAAIASVLILMLLVSDRIS